MTTTSATPEAPRPAATLILVRDDPFEVLMVRRHKKAVFGSALVFPGGAIDPSDFDESWNSVCKGGAALEPDERARRIGAIRETWEETSILVASHRDGAAATVSDRMPGMPFRDAIEASGAVLELDALDPFGHWITPSAEPRRFDARFYLAAAPAGQRALSDGGETVDVEWVRPSEAVAWAEAGERTILFPTLMNLARLAESVDTASAQAAARSRPSYTVEPQLIVREDGSRLITIPLEAGYPATEFVSR